MGLLNFFRTLFRRRAPRRVAAGSGRGSTELPTTPNVPLRRKDRTAAESAPARHGAMPSAREVAEACDDFGLSLAPEDPAAGNRKERRRCFRVAFPGLVARVPELGHNYRVRDVSAGGVGLHCKARVKPGAMVTVTLGLPPKTVFVAKVRAKVMRCESGVLGLAFQEPDRHQEDALNKLVLEAQKRAAELRRGKRTLPDEIQNLKL